MSDELLTPGTATHQLAIERPDEVVLICGRAGGGQDQLTRHELDQRAAALAHRLIADGVEPGQTVATVMPNSIEHMVAILATYMAGGTPFPIAYRMPEAERGRVIELAAPRVVIGEPEAGATITPQEITAPPEPVDLPPRAVPSPVKIVASGGSTGTPKLIVSPGALEFPPTIHPTAIMLGVKPDDLFYSPGPLYHNAPFFFSVVALISGARIMLNERFNASQALDLIEQNRVTALNLVPTMMQRMLREPDWETRDLSSVRLAWHLAAPCPAWAKEGFIDRFGGDAIMELWGATETTGITTISGTEWLEHKGSVGKGLNTEFRILDPDRNELPPGEVGEVFSRFGGTAANYQYVGASALEVDHEGFASVGDMGYVDEDGYLFLADRRTDMIISGGSNIFPAEVEQVISSHPGVGDVAVIGLLDDDLGRKVWAVVEPIDAAHPPSATELLAACADQLARYKVPRGIEFVDALPRNEAGKIRRLSLREERGG